MQIEQACTHEGPRFMVTVSATEAGTTEAGPTMLCCGLCLVAAKVIANDLRDRAPELALAFDISPVVAA